MAFAADTGNHKVTESDVYLVDDPTALIVDWPRTSAAMARNHR